MKSNLVDIRAEAGASAVRAMPASVRVGAADIALIQWPPISATASTRWGEFSSMEHVIRIQMNMPTPQRAVEVLLHEVLHAIWWAYGINDHRGKEEPTVLALGHALAVLWRDNPGLGAWVAEWSSWSEGA